MFDKNELEIIEQVGREGLSLKVAASQLAMTFTNFMEEFNDNEEAQLAYERGQSVLEIEAVTLARERMKEGDQKAFEFVTNSVLNMNGKSKAEGQKTSTKKTPVPAILLNPSKLAELDDEEMQRRIEQKAAQEAAQKPVVKKEEENE